jgi:hypothetical protein
MISLKGNTCSHHVIAVFALFFFHILARKPNIEKHYIYSNKFFQNFDLSESSFTCHRLRASG